MLSAFKTSTFLIVLVALLAHGLVLLNDGVYWDGWIYSELRAQNDWDALYKEWSDYGAPVAAYMIWLPGYFLEQPLGNKLVNFASLLLAAILIYHISKKSDLLSSSESLMVALLSLVYPAFQYAVEYIATAVLIPYAAFFAAIYIALLFEESSGWQRWAWRMTSLVLFFGVAFWLASLLVYYLGFISLLLVYQHQKSGTHWRESVLRFVRTRLDFLVLPLLFWAMRTMFFAPRNYYEDYNGFQLDVNIFYRVLEFISNGVLQQFNRTLQPLISFPVWLVVILLVIIGLYRTAYPIFHKQYQPRTNAMYLLGFALLLSVLGIMPYVLVGSTPLVEGTKTRFNLLLGLPVALMILAVVRLIVVDSARTFMVMTFWILAFGVATVTYYVDWQARWLHDQSIVTNLAAMDAPQDVSVIWIDDHYPLGPDEHYRVYEWSSIFGNAWDDKSRIGLAVGDQTNIYEPQRFANFETLREFDASHCQAVLTIQQGSRPESYNDSLGLSGRYYVFRYLLRGHLDDYLRDVTQLEFRRILAPQATNCTAQQNFLEAVPDASTLFEPDEFYFLHTERIAAISDLEQSALAPFEPITPLDDSTHEALETGGFDPDFYQLYRIVGYNQ